METEAVLTSVLPWYIKVNHYTFFAMGAEEKNAKPATELDNVSVGHAGLYFSGDETLEEGVEKVTNVLTTFAEIMCDIPLGIKDGGKTLITCEKGIKAFVRDELAKTREPPT